MIDGAVPSNARLETPRLELRGNRVCLDFVNSLDPRKGNSREFLHSYTDLLAWGVHASLLSATEVDALLKLAERHPAEAAQVFVQAIELRETLYRLFHAISQGKDPTEADQRALQRAFVNAAPHARMIRTSTSFEWDWPADALESPLWRLTFDAVELLRTADPARLKECANPTSCGWLFYDTSKNNRRRWCSMASCGVPDKVRQQRRRRHNQKA